MATVTFRIHYATRWGENLFVERRSSSRGGEATTELLPMSYAGEGFWTLTLEAGGTGEQVEYRYVFRDAAGEERREPLFRELAVDPRPTTVLDSWFASESPAAAFFRQAFAGVIFQPERSALPSGTAAGESFVRLTLRAARVPAGHRVCVSGSHPRLGNWDPALALPMSGAGYPLWEVELPLGEFTQPVEYKFGLWDVRAGRLVEFERGANRLLSLPPGAGHGVVVNAEHFRHANLWRGAGVAIPVFALRTERGYGIGEFADLAPFAEWAANCGLRLVQVLPINDTSSDFTWRDSYPYKAISTAALHPVYIHLDELHARHGVPLPPDHAERRDALNRRAEIDYEVVLRDKLACLRALYDQVGAKEIASREFARYFRAQSGWLRPYAAFCVLRDRHGTADFARWGEHARYSARRVAAWFKPSAPEHAAAMFHCWVQFHLDRQLAAALAAGHARGVAFKGDLPIGIDRTSVEAWTEPELFRLDRQTGAPPDAFAVLGQNWGFPTYNWARMEADGFAWWRRRFHRMSEAFDALRIDHILGFFRIWEIPIAEREGILGHYNPTLPLNGDEVRAAGVALEPEAFTVGTLAEVDLAAFFGDAAEVVSTKLLQRGADGFFRLRAEMSAAAARQRWYAESGLGSAAEAIEAGVTRLGFEVMFLEDPDQPGRLHPRINLPELALFKSLPAGQQQALRRLHDDFYFRRHNAFWAKVALQRLPPLMDASRMLICGEDLGLVPDCVPQVLGRLGLLSLEVQRWPKQLGQRFSEPAAYPYLSVSTTSTHDMSTIRGWWEEEPATRQHFWAEVMRRDGEAPAACSPDICRFVVGQNLAGASMWCVLPLQDWLGVSGELRRPVAAEERINVPAVPRHYWRYRMHLTIGQLQAATGFNETVAGLVRASGRGETSAPG